MKKRINRDEFKALIEDLHVPQKFTSILKQGLLDKLEELSDVPEYILAIDFDLTICVSEYPALGPMRKDAAKIIRALHAEGFGIVINTCREGHALSDAMHWLRYNGIPYHYVNCNFPHLIERYGADCRKISADMYIDDKGVDPLPEWQEIYDKIHAKFR